MEAAAQSVESPVFWTALKESVVFHSECEQAMDLILILKEARGIPSLRDDEAFWDRMSEKAESLKDKFTIADLIDLFVLYREQKRSHMVRQLVSECRSYAVEDIEVLNIKETLTVMEMYQGDKNLKRFLGKRLKDKMLKNQNLTMQELMTCVG